MNVDKSKSPYFDDYNEEKGFHEILFRPRKAVQTRELNQFQSMFHEQIRRFGNHVFEEGSQVIPGETNYDLDLQYVTLSIPNFGDVSGFLNADDLGLKSQNGISARTKIYKAPEGQDPATFYIEYLDASSDGETSKFQAGDSVDIILNGSTISTATVLDNGVSSKFTMNSGVYYLNGRFVLVEKETVLLDKYSNTPSKIVCIVYNEVVITENEDTSLFDIAQGTPNFTAPGAHRLRVDTSLEVYNLVDLESLPDNAVEIFRIDSGQIQNKARGPEYNILNDVMAQRTYEESGDYTVKAFKIGFSEYDEVYGEVDDNKFSTQLEPGLAYVKGYRVETLGKTNIKSNKARETSVLNNSSISAALGYYVVVSGLSKMPDVTSLQQITFYDSAVDTPGNEPSGAILGTARVRFIRAEGGGEYRLYLFDAKDDTGKRTTSFVSNALSVYSSIGTTFSADLVESELVDASNNSLLFGTNVEFVKTLRDELGNSDTSFASVKQYDGTLDSNGQITFSAAANETFVAQDSTFAFTCYTDTGTFTSVTGNYTLGGSPTGSIITLDYGVGNAGRPIRTLLQVAKEQVSQKTKTTQTTSVSGSLTSGRLDLNKADAIKINSVTDDNGDDVTSLFALVTNKTKSYYGVSYITTTASVAEPVVVSFDYFSHSGGDYFGPDSYVDLDYEDIPYEDGVRLSDVLDFRPRIADNGSNFSGTGSIVGNIPTPFSIIRADIEHYLSRIDKVYVDVDGVFGVAEGVPALEPKEPASPVDVMVLYQLEVPAYTFSLSDIQATKINNRRYTMRDIGTLENRISDIEYYVSLNSLEQEADSKQIIDPSTGLNRFKNGFLTDTFVDHSVGDFAWPLYHVSMAAEGEMRPEFSLNAVDLYQNTGSSSNVVNNAGIVTLPYTEGSFIRQNLRSTTINVNPYAVYRWSGDLTLMPSVDSWIDTVYTNPDVTYEVFNNGRLTQTWNSWQLSWSGGSSRRTTSSTRSSFSRRTTTTRTTTTNTNIDVVNDRVLDTSVIPFMRSIDVGIEGVGHRPRARLHFFFDGVDVDTNIKPSGGTFGGAVRADDDGNFNATFRIPNNDSRKFRTGEKQLIATDEPNNVREDSTSYAETTFVSTGVRNTRQQTIVATRNINTSTRTTTSRINRTFGNGGSDGGGGGGGADPLAQSFLVEREGGAFITKINTFFSTKDESVPVKVEVREMENGIPTLRVVPGGTKTLNPSQVNVSDNGTVPTTFEFDYPIYLMSGVEYCFVVMSNSNNYNAHIATMGERDLATDKFIVEQPYTGVMFKSQNNTTWTEDQNSDLQFEIFCATFDTNVTGTLILNNSDLDMIQLPQNPIKTTISSAEVVITRAQHNYVVGSNITLSGVDGGNNLPDSVLNKSHTVSEVVSPNEFKIVLSSSASATGDIGGTAVMISNTIQASLLNPNITDIEFPNTLISYRAKGTSGMSIDGTESPYAPFTDYIDLTNKEVNFLENPWIMTNVDDEAVNTSGNKCLTVEVTLSSINSNISPVIDLQGASVITPFALITKPAKQANGENNWANYRTRVTSIKDPANSLRAYIDVEKPEGAELIISARMGNSTEEIEESSWVELNGDVVQTTGSGEGFLENEYSLENIDPFTQYQLMVQLKSDSSTRFPICKRLRVLALGT